MLAATYTFREKGHPAVRRCIVGGEPLLLKNRYDPNQHWLPFMIGAAYEPLEEPVLTPAQIRANKTTLQKKIEQAMARAAKPYATIDDKYQTMHVLEDLNQGILPFDGHWRIGNKSFSKLQKAKLPGFERTESGKICTIYFETKEREELLAWCRLNATGFYNVTKKHATFAKVLDAVAARLVFGVAAPR